MQSSSVLIVHPPADSRFRLPDMSNGKLIGGGHPRHYSLDSPSLTSPPGYGVSSDLHNMPLPSMSMLDQKPPIAMSTTHSLAMSSPASMSMSMNVPSTAATMPIHSSHQFPSFNPATGLVMAPAAPPGLLQLSKFARHGCEIDKQAC